MSYSVASPSRETAKLALVRLWNRNFPGHWETWYDWACDENPCGPVWNWVVECAGEPVGSTSLMQRTLQVAGETYSVGQAIHINVNPEHRTLLSATKLQRALLAHADELQLPFVFGVTEAAVPLFRRVGYQPVGSVERWAKPFRSESHLRGRIPQRLPRAIASRCVDAALRLGSGETWFRRPAGQTIVLLDSFDERFDRLWQRLAALNDRILAPRTRRFLEWRFSRHPKAPPSRILALTAGDGELRGYLVFSLGPIDDGSRPARIHDLLADSPDVTRSLIAEVCRHLREFDVTSLNVQYCGSPELARLLRRFGFFLRSCGQQLLVRSGTMLTAERLAAVLQPARWHLTEADFDF